MFEFQNNTSELSESDSDKVYSTISSLIQVASAVGNGAKTMGYISWRLGKSATLTLWNGATAVYSRLPSMIPEVDDDDDEDNSITDSFYSNAYDNEEDEDPKIVSLPFTQEVSIDAQGKGVSGLQINPENLIKQKDEKFIKECVGFLKNKSNGQLPSKNNEEKKFEATNHTCKITKKAFCNSPEIVDFQSIDCLEWRAGIVDVRYPKKIGQTEEGTFLIMKQSFCYEVEVSKK